MRPRANTLFPLVLMVALAAMTFWLEHAVQAPEPPGRDTSRHDPDFMAENFTVTTMDTNGQPKSTLTADKMVHFADDESTDLVAPRVTQQRETGPPLTAVADRGTMTKDAEQIDLYGNVVVTRQATPERPALRVDTSYLQVFPKSDIARTPEYVLITEGKSRLSGVGMEANNKTQVLHVLSDVKGTIDRTPVASKPE